MVENKVSYKAVNESNREFVKNKIKDELIKLNYNFNYTGTDYLIETIYLLYSSKNYYNFSLETDVYPVISDRSGIPSRTIKSNIVNATDKMYYDCNEEILKRYIGKYQLVKPGPKQIVKSVLKRIKDI